MDTIYSNGLKGVLGQGAALRELQCLLEIAAGASGKEAARKLGISEDGVKKRLLALTTKLGVKRRAELVAVAFRKGIIAPAACAALALLFGLQPAHQQSLTVRRPEAPRRVELRVAARRHSTEWVA